MVSYSLGMVQVVLVTLLLSVASAFGQATSTCPKPGTPKVAFSSLAQVSENDNVWGRNVYGASHTVKVNQIRHEIQGTQIDLRFVAVGGSANSKKFIYHVHTSGESDGFKFGLENSVSCTGVIDKKFGYVWSVSVAEAF